MTGRGCEDDRTYADVDLVTLGGQHGEVAAIALGEVLVLWCAKTRREGTEESDALSSAGE